MKGINVGWYKNSPAGPWWTYSGTSQTLDMAEWKRVIWIWNLRIELTSTKMKKIRFTTRRRARRAGRWAMKKYSGAFKKLAEYPGNDNAPKNTN